MNEKEKTDENNEESILDNSTRETGEEITDDDIVRITKVLRGQRQGSLSIHWRQNMMFFRGFARNRSKTKPNEFTIHCFRNTSYKGKACNFSFKARCSFDRSSDDFYNADNWVVLSATKKTHLGLSNNQSELEDRFFC